jgi:acyl carrier protein
MTAEDVEDWDSLSHVRLIVAIELAFGIKFAVWEVVGLKNVGDLVAVIERRVAAR